MTTPRPEPDRARSRPVQQVLMATIARRFYLDGLNKVQIADELGISRFKVARWLAAAQEQGIVRIEIDTPAEFDAERSAALRTRLGLSTVIIVDTPGSPAELLRRNVAQVGAQLLEGLLDDGEVLGIAWGRTMVELTAAVTTLPPCTVVQLCGAFGGGAESRRSPVELVTHLARVSGGEAYPLHAPLLVTDPDAARVLRRQPEVAQTMRRFDDVTTAVLSIGAWQPTESTVFDGLDDVERRRIAAHGVCGEACGVLVDAEGRVLTEPLADRLIAIDHEQLRSIPRVIALATGAARATAVLAIARSGLIDVLVTDVGVARRLLGEDPAT